MRQAQRAPYLLAGAVAVVVLVVLCALAIRADEETPRGPVARQLDHLTSSANRLTFAPFLLGEPGDLWENADGQRIRELLDIEAQVRVPADRQDGITTEAREAGPVTGRHLLHLLDAGIGLPGDLARVRRSRLEDGSYAEYDGQAPAERTATTARAVDLLGEDLASAERDLTARWLDGQLAAAVSSGDPAHIAAAAQGLHALGRPPRSELPTLNAPDATGFPELPQEGRSLLLQQTYAYVWLQEATGATPHIDVTSWTKVLGSSVDELPLADLAQLTFVLVKGGVAPEDLAAVRQRLERDTLPSGLLRARDAYVGDVVSTLFGLLIRQQAGEGTADPALADALRATARNAPADAQAQDGLVRATAVLLSAGEKPPSAALQPCETPTQVDIDTVTGWQRLAIVCHAAGAELASPDVASWSTRSPQGAVGAARLINALALHGQGLPDWVESDDLRRLLSRPAALRGLTHEVEVAQALLHLGVEIDPEIARTLRTSIEDARGCPGLPDLYRATDDAFSCDLGLTYAVGRLRDGLR